MRLEIKANFEANYLKVGKKFHILYFMPFLFIFHLTLFKNLYFFLVLFIFEYFFQFSQIVKAQSVVMTQTPQNSLASRNIDSCYRHFIIFVIGVLFECCYLVRKKFTDFNPSIITAYKILVFIILAY